MSGPPSPRDGHEWRGLLAGGIDDGLEDPLSGLATNGGSPMAEASSLSRALDAQERIDALFTPIRSQMGRADSSVPVDPLASRRDHVPGGTEVRQTFAGGLTALGVAGEEVQRVPGIGHLAASVCPPDAGE